MSAQDYPLMFSPSRTTRHNVAASTAGLLLEAAVSAFRESVRRHHLWRLADLDANQLRDYGITRDEITQALEQPLTVNATTALKRARRENAHRHA